MKHFESTKKTYYHLFKAIALLTIFLLRHRLNFTFEVIGEHLNDLAKHG
jgi:hypothetical protein